MKRQSTKKQKENRERGRLKLILIKERGPLCQAKIPGTCSGLADDMHERLPRGRGGSATDPTNIILICRGCHTWVGLNPKVATERGLLRSWNTEEDGQSWEK